MICQRCGKAFERPYAQLNCSIQCGCNARFANATKRHKARRDAQQLSIMREYVLELRAANKREEEQGNT